MMKISSPALDQSTIYISRNEDAVNTTTNGKFGGRKSKLRNSLAVYETLTTPLALVIPKSPFSFFYFPQRPFYFLPRVKVL